MQKIGTKPTEAKRNGISGWTWVIPFIFLIFGIMFTYSGASGKGHYSSKERFQYSPRETLAMGLAGLLCSGGAFVILFNDRRKRSRRNQRSVGANRGESQLKG